MNKKIALLMFGLMVSGTALMAQKEADKKKATPAPPPKSGWQMFGSWRVRSEIWNWFRTDKARNDYNFEASMLRYGAMRQTSREETLLELEQTSFLGLPTGSTAPAPQGQLGTGSSYRVANGTQVASLFVRQGYVKLKNFAGTGDAVKLGRYEFSDGMELPSSNPSLALLKRDRIGQRLIGPFGFTHVGRSLDGVQITSDHPHENTTFLWAFPTRGSFSLRGMDTLTGIQLAYLSRTANHQSEHLSTEGRLFTAFYDDSRKGVTMTDNRPAATRAADTRGVHIGTLGGHTLGVYTLGGGKLDTLLWGAAQFGEWGSLQQGAYAYSAEIGYQPDKMAWKPWFRAGYYYASGDGDATNGKHGAFFPMIPTPRPYARLPFYSLTNLKDLFAEVVLRPTSKLTLRSDVHQLGLANGHDLWYSGGGAYDNSAFGYTGRPSGGNTGLGTLYDVSLDYQARKNLTVTLYLGYAHGGDVIKNTYQGSDATLGYAEFTLRF